MSLRIEYCSIFPLWIESFPIFPLWTESFPIFTLWIESFPIFPLWIESFQIFPLRVEAFPIFSPWIVNRTFSYISAVNGISARHPMGFRPLSRQLWWYGDGPRRMIMNEGCMIVWMYLLYCIKKNKCKRVAYGIFFIISAVNRISSKISPLNQSFSNIFAVNRVFSNISAVNRMFSNISATSTRPFIYVICLNH